MEQIIKIPILKIQFHYKNIPTPKKTYSTDAGIDLTAIKYEEKKNNIFYIDTGISIKISKGFYVEIVPRSSIVKTNFIMANSIGVIDPDYRGKIFIALLYTGKNSGKKECEKLINCRIAQMLVRRMEDVKIKIVNDLEKTERGNKGFGSSGAK